MALIDKLDRIGCSSGQHHHRHARRQARRPTGPGGGKALTVRVADRKVAFDSSRNPRLGVGEAYMDGRLIDRGRRRSSTCCELITGNEPLGRRRQRPQGDQQGQAQAGKRAVPAQRAAQLEAQRRPSLRPRRRALRALPRRRPAIQLRLFHRPGQQPRAGAGRQEGAYRRQAPPEARPARARHRLRLGRDGALPEQGRRRRRPRHHLVRGAAEGRAPARRGGGRRRPGQVRADRLSPLDGQFDRIVSVGMFEHVGARALRRILRQVPRAAEPTTG